MAVKDYSSLYKIKDFMMNNVAPEYFDMSETSDLNIGIFGYITEILANTVEDSLLTTTMLFKEQFPVIAEKPESIYLSGALFQLLDLFATPATVNFLLLLNEDSIIKQGTVENGFITLNIDSDMEINIEGKQFMMDYDVKIMAKKTSKGYVYNAYYIIDHDNDISTLTRPYIKTVIHNNDNNQRYLGLYLSLHQVSKTTIADTIISNDTINVVSKEYAFDGQIANFEIFYKSNSGATPVQLIKKPANTSKETNPFCYYRFSDENKLVIEFANDERYFIPEFNSELEINIYTTLGSGGNFTQYQGSNVQIIGKSTKYTSNKGLIFIGIVQGESIGGYDRNTVEEFRNEVIKAWSTIQSFTTSNDLTLYFNSLQIKELNDLLIIKQRDDALIRLFSTFVLFRDADNNVIPTNTCDMKIKKEEIDVSYPQSNRYVLKAGKIYSFEEGSKYFVKERKDIKLTDNLDVYEGKEFIYVNPFLTVLGNSPIQIGFYLNTIDDSISLDYSEVNDNTIYQFIVNTLDIYRDAINGEDEYEITLKLIPTTSLPEEAFELVTDDMIITDDDRTFVNETDGLLYKDKGLLRAIILYVSDAGSRSHYIDLELAGFDETSYHMKARCKTTDYVTLQNQLEMISGFKNITTGEEDEENVLIESYGVNVEIYTFYKIPNEKFTHIFDENPILKPYTMTNKYVVSENASVNFIIPIPEIVSTLTYVKDVSEGEEVNFSYEASAIPLIKANYLNKRENFKYFLNTFNNIYKYIKLSMDLLVNNFDINLKFFNTYGYSHHYIIPTTENSDTINRINIKIHYAVKFGINSNIDDTVNKMKETIRDYIESSKISLISKPSLNISKLNAELINTYPSIQYIIFKGIDDYGESLQYIESEITEENIIQGNFSTADIIPEYLNIDYIYKENTKTLQVVIDVL